MIGGERENPNVERGRRLHGDFRHNSADHLRAGEIYKSQNSTFRQTSDALSSLRNPFLH